MKTAVPVLTLLFAIASCTVEPASEPDGERGASGKADAVTGSCAEVSFCGGVAESGGCYCDEVCASHGDCCSDAADVCGVDSNRLEDRTAGKTPLLGSAELETVIDLPFPPGNVAVSAGGRVFFSFHPDGNKGDTQVAEIVGGEVVAFPSEEFQKRLETVLSVRVDAANRLWMLDHGKLGFHRAKLYAVDLATSELVFEYKFPRTAAGIGSFLNDMQIAPDGETVYISDPSPLAHKSAIVVVDIAREHPIARRRLVKHESVISGPFDVFVDDVLVRAFGIRPDYGIDGLTLDQTGEYLYYGALNGGELYRVATADLRFEKSGLDDEALAQRVEKIADITMSDGMASDAAGNIYLTDMEHYAVTRVSPTGELDVLIADDRLRWPDGLSWAPTGELYVTASALQQYMPELHKSEKDIAKNAPYQIYRLMPQRACDSAADCSGVSGH